MIQIASGCTAQQQGTLGDETTWSREIKNLDREDGRGTSCHLKAAFRGSLSTERSLGVAVRNKYDYYRRGVSVCHCRIVAC